jgi:hypothetical protein
MARGDASAKRTGRSVAETGGQNPGDKEDASSLEVGKLSTPESQRCSDAICEAWGRPAERASKQQRDFTDTRGRSSDSIGTNVEVKKER